MCIPNTLQQHILNITNGGKTVADFLHATMQGETHNAKIHHQIEAAKQLTNLALTYTPSPSTGEGRDGGENPVHPEPAEKHDSDATHEPCSSSFASPLSSFLRKQESTLDDSAPQEATENPIHPVHPVSSTPVTDIDIINYEIARLIRETTNDGFLIAEFLARVMHGSRPGELEYSHRDRVISAADRMAAAKELLNRGFGRLGDSRRAARQDDSDLVQSGLARYIRERTEHGMEAVRLLLDVASGEDEQFSMHQRVVATRELMRRGWDINYDAITSADIVAYYQRQDTLEPTKYDIRLQEWREQERARRQTVGATGRSPEAEPQPEAGLFAHMDNAEIARYESMTAQEQADFIKQLRAHRAAAAQPETDAAHPINQPEAAVAPADQPKADVTQLANQPKADAAQPTNQPETAAAQPDDQPKADVTQRTNQPETAAVQPDSIPVIPAPSPVIPAEAGIHTPNTPDNSNAAETQPEADLASDDSENTDWNTLLQQITTPSRTSHPTYPVPSRALIRSP